MSILGNEKLKKITTPVWQGPELEGITVSLLSRFLSCRERFRCLVIEGLKPKDEFNHRLEFGSMWHLCEEVLSKQKMTHEIAKELRYKGTIVHEAWEIGLKQYASKLCSKYPLQQEEVGKWYNICKLMFPICLIYWGKSKIKSTPLLQEQVFDVPYKLPNSKTVKLKGKWDSVSLEDNGIWLGEHKSKGDIDSEKIQRQLSFDLQTMFYIVALTNHREAVDGKLKVCVPGTNKDFVHQYPIKGVNYNVIRRPRQYQGKKETKEAFYLRLEEIVKDDPESFFMRWKVEITSGDISNFKKQFLDPCLMNLCEWWDFVSKEKNNPFKDVFGIHWRHPFGCTNYIDEGSGHHLDEYLASGDDRGLVRTTELFPELKE